MLNESFVFTVSGNLDNDATYSRRDGMEDQAENYFKLLNDAEQELPPNGKNIKNLSCMIRLFQFEVLNNWRDESVTMLV